MTITMHDTKPYDIAELRMLLASLNGQTFKADSKAEAYDWIEGQLKQYRYGHLSKAERGVVRQYLRTYTGYSVSQLSRLIGGWSKNRTVRLKTYQRHKFARHYTREDIVLLAHVDSVHNLLSGPATRRVLERAYTVFGQPEYLRLSGISASHIYNLRGTEVYHNQYEFVACVETIGERDLLPVLESILASFPFVIHEFHADNGSEYINRIVAKLLKKLRITLSKSRPRQHNDNALVETKNGSIIRKAIGYGHIPKQHARAIDAWYQNWFNDYLNYHRPCAFATITKSHKGKEKLVYKSGDYQMPYDKLKSLPNANCYLRPGITFDQLDKLAYAVSDTEYAEFMNQAQDQLKEAIHGNHKPVAGREQTFS